jgi:membrane protein implicated in regulation of membrane protease activity
VLKSPWMLLMIVPGGFLLVAAAAAFGPAESTTAAWVFVGLSALAFIVGGLLTFTFARRSTVPTPAKVRRFARDWVSRHPGATEKEARTALLQWFGGSTGSTGTSDWYSPPSGNLVDSLAATGFVSLVAWLGHRYFPTAPARPEDIDEALRELGGEGHFNGIGG